LFVKEFWKIRNRNGREKTKDVRIFGLEWEGKII